MNETIEQYGTMDEVIERFKEVIATAKPGQFIEFNFLVPKPKKEIVQMHTIRGQKAKEIGQLVNDALLDNSITEAGYIAMDANGTWSYYDALPEADEEEQYFVPSSKHRECIELIQINPKDIDLHWTKTIRYVY